MSITAASVKQDILPIGATTLQRGTATFNGTDQTGTVNTLLKRYRAAFVAPLQAPGTVTRSESRNYGTVSATTSFPLVVPPYAGTIASIKITVATTLATDNTNYWTFSITNKGSGGAGVTVLLAATDANTTKTTGGSAITAYAARTLTLTGTAADLIHAAGDTLQVTCTKASAASNLVSLEVQVNTNVGDIGEMFYFDEGANVSNGVIKPVSGVLNIKRAGPALAATSAAKVGYIADGY